MSVGYAEMNDLLNNFNTNGVGGQPPLAAGSVDGTVNQDDVGMVVTYPSGNQVAFYIGKANKVSFNGGMMWVEYGAETYVFDPSAPGSSLSQINANGGAGTTEPYFLSMDANTLMWFYTGLANRQSFNSAKPVPAPVTFPAGSSPPQQVTTQPAVSPSVTPKVKVKTPSPINTSTSKMRPFANWDGGLPALLS